MCNKRIHEKYLFQRQYIVFSLWNGDNGGGMGMGYLVGNAIYEKVYNIKI